MADYHLIETKKLSGFCEKSFATFGFSAEESKIITDVLLRADISGIESHGVNRMFRYYNEIKSGMVDPKAKSEVVHETNISAVIDGNKSMGQLVGVQAMKIAIKKAQQHGFGIVTVRNSNHYGIASYYCDMAAEADLVGISMTNTEAIAVPTFGSKAMLGTNPIALTMPADPVAFSFDASTSVVTRGKLEVYYKNNKPLPEQWALGADGIASTNAKEVLNNIIQKLGGGIAPLGGVGELSGGHKGYGLGFIVELFTALFSGGLTANYVNVTPGLIGICNCFMALDYGIFGSKEEIKKRVSVYMQELRDSRKAEGQDRIYTHGEKEAEIRASRINGFIPVNDKTLKEMMDIAAAQGVPWNLDVK